MNITHSETRDPKEVFSENLKKYMQLKGVTQKELMEEFNLPSATISSWVNGKRMPRMDKIQLLAGYLGVSKADLIESTDTVFTTKNIPMPKPEVFNMFSGSDKVLYDILDEMLKKEEKEELNRRLKERLPGGNWKPSTIAARFDGDEYTEDELDEIKQFAQFVKSQRKN